MTDSQTGHKDHQVDEPNNTPTAEQVRTGLPSDVLHHAMRSCHRQNLSPVVDQDRALPESFEQANERSLFAKMLDN